MRYLFAALVILAALLIVSTSKASVSTNRIPVVYVGNFSTTLSNDAVAAALPAIQSAVDNEFTAAWGTDAILTTDDTVPHQMEIAIEDHPGCANCLGFHVVWHGMPLSIVSPTGQWTITFTHELFEMLADPWVNTMSLLKARFILREVCDPVENDAYAGVDGLTPISDFIMPKWYNGALRGPVDYMGVLKAPGTLAKGGYYSYWLRNHWVQVGL